MRISPFSVGIFPLGRTPLYMRGLYIPTMKVFRLSGRCLLVIVIMIIMMIMMAMIIRIIIWSNIVEVVAGVSLLLLLLLLS